MNWQSYMANAIDSAQRAGDMLRSHIQDAREISFKGAVDLVTNFDNKSQHIIVDSLAANYPDFDFLAEEGLQERKGSEYRWIIDPIDGTTNFAHGFPVFCISIALENQGEVKVGVIYDPMRDEMFSASKGGGAALNGVPIGVSMTGELDKSLLSTGFPYDVRDSQENNLDHFGNFAVRAQAIRRCGSAALDLCYVACGRFDGFWELKLAPWDVAAGVLIVSEAKGQVTDFSGDPVDIYSKEILAYNGIIHEQMMAVLQMQQDNTEG